MRICNVGRIAAKWCALDLVTGRTQTGVISGAKGVLVLKLELALFYIDIE